MQTQSAFDPSSLLDTEYTDDLNTRLTPIPEGEFYARIKPDGIIVREIINKQNEKRHVADVIFEIDDEEVKRQTQLTTPQVRCSIFLDLKPGTSQLLTKEDNANANVRLGRLKEACGIKPGKKWSLRHLEGLGCYVKVKQRADPEDIETVYSDVVAFSSEPSRRTAA